MLEEESEQLDMFSLKKAKETCQKKGSGWFWCDVDKKCKRVDPPTDSALSEGAAEWKQLDELTERFRMVLAASCDDIKISEAGGHRLNVNGIIVRVEGHASDEPGIGGVTSIK